MERRSAEWIQAVVAAVSGGMTLVEAGKKFGCSTTTVHKFARRAGLALKKGRRVGAPNPFRNVDRELAVMRLFDGGETCADLASRLGVSRQRAHQIVLQARSRISASTL